MALIGNYQPLGDPVDPVAVTKAVTPACTSPSVAKQCLHCTTSKRSHSFHSLMRVSVENWLLTTEMSWVRFLLPPTLFRDHAGLKLLIVEVLRRECF